MSEEGGLKEYTRVPRRVITIKTPLMDGDFGNLVVGEDNVVSVVDYAASVQARNILISAEKVTPSPRLALATTYARTQVNNLRISIGLPPVEEGRMAVSYLPQDKFNQAYRGVYGLSEDAPVYSSGFDITPGVGAVVSLIDNRTDYLLGATALHELIHEYLEKFVGVYNIEISSNTQSTLYVEGRRSGLYTKGRGAVLNELPNYYYEGCYIEEVVKLYQQEFQDEIDARQRYLQEREFYEDKHSFSARGSDNESKRIIVNKKFIHFDKDGSLFAGASSMFIYMQFADDISQLCGDVNGEPFMKFMLRAKTDPHLLPEVRRVINSRIGEGFFEVLRNAKYAGETDVVVELLVDIQKRLYAIEQV